MGFQIETHSHVAAILQIDFQDALNVHDGTDWARLGKIYHQPKRLPGQLRAVVMQLESNERLWNRAGQLAQPPIRYF